MVKILKILNKQTTTKIRVVFVYTNFGMKWTWMLKCQNGKPFLSFFKMLKVKPYSCCCSYVWLQLCFCHISEQAITRKNYIYNWLSEWMILRRWEVHIWQSLQVYTHIRTHSHTHTQTIPSVCDAHTLQ